MTLAAALPLAALPILVLAAANDVAVRRVPDSASLAVGALGLAAQAAAGGLLMTLLVMAGVFLALFACWKRGWLGGGDVKLLTACSALVPAALVPDLFLAVSLCGGVLALAYLAARRLPPGRRGPAPRFMLLRVLVAERWRMRRRASLPYACAIAGGSFVALGVA